MKKLFAVAASTALIAVVAFLFWPRAMYAPLGGNYLFNTRTGCVYNMRGDLILDPNESNKSAERRRQADAELDAQLDELVKLAPSRR